MSMVDPRGSTCFPEFLETPAGRGPPPRAPRAKDWKPSSIDDQVRHAYYVPSSHEYRPEVPGRFAEPLGGRISQANVPSALDAPVRTGQAVPGPGAYEVPPPHFLPEGGRMYGRPDAVKALTAADLKGDDDPGPAKYTPADTLTKPGQAGVKFEKGSKEAKYLKDAARLAAQVPGPGAYDAMSAAEYVKPFVPEGGRAGPMASKPTKTYFDDAAALTRSNPGPAAYMLPGSIDVRPVGQPVFRHESATLKESAKLVERMVDSSANTPGPGAYTLPDPHPLMPAPSLKSKSLAHGMPKPFDYNAAPDYAGNFAPRPKELKQLAPVRQRNSGDQIFGRFSASGGPQRSGDNNNAGGGGNNNSILDPSGSGMAEDVWEDEPDTEPGISAPQEEIEDRVVWREGGFEPSGKGSRMTEGAEESGSGMMPRSRSMGALGGTARGGASGSAKSSRHPAVEKAAKSYNRLSGHRKKATKTFLPMAGRRCPVVHTEDTSAEFQRYWVCKSRLEEAGERISQAGAQLMEPLDVNKLLSDAQDVLEMKARMRLRVEGLSREKRAKVLYELPMLFQDASSRYLGGPDEAGEDVYGQLPPLA